MHVGKIALALVALMICVNIAHALPDLVVTGVEFWKSDTCKTPYTLPNGSLQYGKCSFYVGSESNYTHFKTGDVFFAKPVIKNIGNESTVTRFHYTTYIDGKWISLSLAGYFWCGIGTTCPPEMNSINYTMENGNRLFHIGPNQTLPPAVLGAGGGMAMTNGDHNISIYMNEPNWTKDGLVHPTIEELDYTNNVFNWTLISDDQPTNNPPNITSVSDVPEQINEGENITVSFTAADINGDPLTYKILRDNVIVANGSSFTWNTANGYNGTHEFKFVVNDNYTNTTETRYVFVVNSLCASDAECDDGDPNTDDSCEMTQEGMACINLVPNFYGRVNDIATGAPVSGVNISFYNSSLYDVEHGNGNYHSLLPKYFPDIWTNFNGRFRTFLNPNQRFHMVMKHSNEKAFNVQASNTSNSTIITSTDGYIKVFFEKASASLKSDLYISLPVNQLLVQKSTVGKVVYINNNATYPAGTELKFYIKVNGTPWGIGVYNHSSDTQYCQIERLDADTWRLNFEDLPANQADWDYNDAVVLVDIVGSTNATVYDNDCDHDGIKNWDDDNDGWCDFGEYNEEISENASVTFDADGYIIYSNEYHNADNYICGERVKFAMFGTNNGTTNQTITFNVQDHTSIDGPTAPIIYTGNMSNSSETLTIGANTTAHKTFYWRIPCGSNFGKYDMNVVWNGTELHNMGNFYIIQDTTAPGIDAMPVHLSAHANQNFTIQYSAWDNPQPGTIHMFKIAMLGYNDTTVNVSVDNGNDGSIEYTSFGGDWLSYTGSFNESGEKQVKLTVTDLSGNNASTYVNVTVFITEDEANAIAIPWYNRFLLNDTGWNDFDFNIDITLDSSYVTLNADRYAGFDMHEEEVGDEYMTPGNTVGTAQYGDFYNLNAVVYGDEYGGGCWGPEWFLPINGTTAVGYNYTLVEYFCYLDNICGIGVEESLCDTYNFAPKFYAYVPQLVNLEIPHTGSQSFNVNVNDANNGNMTVNWYVDDELRWTRNLGAGSGGGIDSRTFVGNSSNIGVHKIFVDVSDPNEATENLDPYNYHTNLTWYLLVT